MIVTWQNKSCRLMRSRSPAPELLRLLLLLRSECRTPSEETLPFFLSYFLCLFFIMNYDRMKYSTGAFSYLLLLQDKSKDTPHTHSHQRKQKKCAIFHRSGREGAHFEFQFLFFSFFKKGNSK